MTYQPRDLNGNTIPLLGLKRGGGAHSISYTGTAARNSTGFAETTKAISIYATTACYVELGTSGVTATSSNHYIPAETRLDISVSGRDLAQATHISAIQVSSGGTLYVSELE